jgi:MFS family permease
MVPLFVLAHFSHHLVMALLPPLMPFIRDDFTISYAQAGWVVSAFSLAYGLSQLPAGWLADRIGPRILILVGTSGVAACGLFTGLSPTYMIVIIALMLMGILGGSYHPAASPLVSASVEEKNRGRALGLHQIGGTGSYFLTPLIAVGTAAIFGGWRGSFISMSILTILIGIVLYILLGRRGYGGSSRKSTPGSDTADSFTPVPKRKLVAFIALGVILQVSVFSTMSFITLFAVDSLKTSEEAAAALLTIMHFGGLWAGPVGGYLSDRIGKVPVMLFVCIAAGPFIYLLSLVSAGWSISLVLLVIGALMYIGMPVTEAYVISHTSERNRSTILGFYYFASRGGPGLITPALGYLIDKFSFDTGFTIMGAAALAILFCCSTLLWGSRD